MLKLKKNLFGIGLAFSVILGVAFSFLPQEISACVKMKLESVGEIIPCSSSTSSSSNWYVDCSSCTRVNGTATGGSGKCRRN